MTNTTTNTKVTQREMFNEIIALATENDRADIVEFCNGRIAQLDKKNASSSSKPKKVTEEQTAMRSAIKDYLATVERATVAEICVAIGETNKNKVTGNITQLYKNGEVQRVTEKKLNYYSI